MWNFSTKEKLNRIEPGDFRWENYRARGEELLMASIFYYIASLRGISLRLLKSFLLFAIQWLAVKSPLNFKMPLSRTPKYATSVIDKGKRPRRTFFSYLNFCLCSAATHPHTSSDDSLNFLNKELNYKHHE